ncbi:MAG: DUF4390 domain-containing protein [candidate division Zixibacteria bacterium]|nr:DUF4390 domain-containing protein [candidate division Zixibacteria bacterium]
MILVVFGGALLSARAERFTSLPVSFAGDTLKVQFPVAAFLGADDSTALVSGEDIALICRMELWQKRKLWFDRLRVTNIHYFTLSYDRWEEKFILNYQDQFGWEVERRYNSLRLLLDYLDKAHYFSLVLERDDYQRLSFLACAVDTKYLTLERMGEIREWLKWGRSAGRESSSLPDRVISFLVKSTGLRNRSELRTSQNFIPAQLQTEIKF